MLIKVLNGKTVEAYRGSETLALKGVELLANAIESYVSSASNERSKKLAGEAIELICKNLESAVKDSDNNQAFECLKVAARLESEAYQIASLGCVQAMSKQIDTVCHIENCLSSAVLSPYIQNYNRMKIADELSEVAKYMGIDTSQMNIEESSRAVVIYLKAMNQRLGIPTHLTEIGVTPFEIEKMAEMTMNAKCMKTTPFEVKFEDVVSLFKTAM